MSSLTRFFQRQTFRSFRFFSSNTNKINNLKTKYKLPTPLNNIKNITSHSSNNTSFAQFSTQQEQKQELVDHGDLLPNLQNINNINNVHVAQKDSSIAGDLPLTELVRDFLSPEDFFNLLHTYGHDFFCGVPDSLLKDFCGYVTDNTDLTNHIITPNEGNAVALAAGYHLGTSKVPVVYLQNSGLGNAINPLLSLTDRKVCNIPMLVLLGWRGEPGRKDEPQHMVQGKITTALLADMGIPFEILPDYLEGANEALETAQIHFQQRGSPYCLLVRKRTFSPYKLINKTVNDYPLTREQVLDLIVDNTSQWDAFVTTTGFTSRELYELRKSKQLNNTSTLLNNKDIPQRDLLMVGSMGHASSIALGLSIAKPSRNIITLDGDGAMLMHTGILSSIGSLKPKNFKHIMLNNGAHDSVGQQPTTAFNTDWCNIAKSCGYTNVIGCFSQPDDIVKAVKELDCTDGPAFLEIRTKPGSRKDLGRPKETPQQNKRGFMEFLRK